MGQGAPGRLRVPVRMPRGRILELNLPLWIGWEHGEALKGVMVSVLMPNAISYGASLERMMGDPELARLLPGARIGYASGDTHTLIDIELPRLKGSGQASLALPISIKQIAGGVHAVMIMAAADGWPTVERRYRLEIEDDDTATPVAEPGSWICRPPEAGRVRELHLPLDRIASTDFSIEPAPPQR